MGNYVVGVGFGGFFGSFGWIFGRGFGRGLLGISFGFEGLGFE